MKNVMIVEDQKMIRSILERYIEKDNELLLVASIEGAEEACEICGMKKIHLILMDVQTAHRENGLAAVRKIKEKYPNIKIVVVTSLVDGEILEQAKCFGADSLWYKDTDEGTLMQVVQRTMAGEHVEIYLPRGAYREFPVSGGWKIGSSHGGLENTLYRGRKIFLNNLLLG